MKLYVLTTADKRNHLYYERAYTDRCMAEHCASELTFNSGCPYEVEEVELPFLGKYVCYVHLYSGFTYGYRDIHDVEAYSHICPSIGKAKENQMWTDLMDRVRADGEDKYIVGLNRLQEHFVATKYYGEPFIFGDYGLGCFNATIHRVKVVRMTFAQHVEESRRFLKKLAY